MDTRPRSCNWIPCQPSYRCRIRGAKSSLFQPHQWSLICSLSASSPHGMEYIAILPNWSIWSPKWISWCLRAFRYLKLQEEIFHSLDLAEIILDICYTLFCMTTVFWHHILVDKGPDAVQSMFERYYLCAILTAAVQTARTPKRQWPRLCISFPFHWVTSQSAFFIMKNPGYGGNVF